MNMDRRNKPVRADQTALFPSERTMGDERSSIAAELFHQAWRCRISGFLDVAVTLYRQSIKLHPTAEAYTHLSWTYRNQGRTQEAIEASKGAILIDPALGHPYNDIGACLIDLECYDEAIPWLEKALAARRYDACHCAWYNLGRVFGQKQMYTRARECFERALGLDPYYEPAALALDRLRRMLQ
jgi:tetratricopeptide (TPR) repeat protein